MTNLVISLRYRWLRIFFILFISLLVVGFLFFEWIPVLMAQDGPAGWSEPVNVSNSSGAEAPLVFVDNERKPHVIWQDILNVFVYSFFDGQNWSDRQPVELPFGTRRFDSDLREGDPTPLFSPLLVSDNQNNVHALWIDDEEILYYSQVDINDFPEFSAWLAPVQLAPSARSFAMAAGDDGTLHMAYIRPFGDDDAPAGLYYRQSATGETSWSDPVLLYESLYFRTTPRSQLNIDLVAFASEQVAVAWDNPGLERVFLVTSGDGGLTWGSAIEIDRRLVDDIVDASGPSDIDIEPSGEELHLVWQAGHDNLICAQYHLVTNDGGQNWAPRNTILAEVDGCVQDLKLISDPDGGLFLFAESESGAMLSGWNGTEWNQPERQPDLDSFDDPQTNRQVAFQCRQALVSNIQQDANRLALAVVGCDGGEGSDIWLRARMLDDLSFLIRGEPEPVWRGPELLGTSTTIQDPTLVADGDGLMHAFWTQPSNPESDRTVIYHARWNGDDWSVPREVLSSPNGGVAIQPSAVVDVFGRILLVWSGGMPGPVLFSQVPTDRAISPADWSSPAALPMPASGGLSPQIALDADGFIYVAYAVPVNENRGIYMVQSADAGQSWLEPILIFDAVKAGWEVADNPRMTISDDGTFHVMWTKKESPLNPEPESLWYSRSMDGGVTWSEEQEVTSSPVGWSEILASGDLQVQRFWSESSGLWSDLSTDTGQSWSQPLRLPGFGTESGPVDVNPDGANRLHLLQISESSSGLGEATTFPQAELFQWTVVDDSWITDEPFSLETFGAEEMVGTVANGNRLVILYTAPWEDSRSAVSMVGVYAGDRMLDLPDLIPTSLPTLTPTSTPQPTATSEPEITPTATPEFPINNESAGSLPLQVNSGNPISNVLLGVVPAGLVVLIVVFVGIRLLRGRQH